jgi:hypothetical protein
MFVDPVITSSGTNVSGNIRSVNLGYTTGSQMQAYLVPTVSSSGSSIGGFAVAFPYQPIFVNDNQSISLAPGHKFLITGKPSVAGKLSYLTIRWVEQ